MTDEIEEAADARIDDLRRRVEQQGREVSRLSKIAAVVRAQTRDLLKSMEGRKNGSV